MAGGEGGDTGWDDWMIGWHYWLNGHEFGHTLWHNDGQGSLACCSPWGCRVDHDYTTEQQQQQRTKSWDWDQIYIQIILDPKLMLFLVYLAWWRAQIIRPGVRRPGWLPVLWLAVLLWASHFLFWAMVFWVVGGLVTQSCLTLCDPRL